MGPIRQSAKHHRARSMGFRDYLLLLYRRRHLIFWVIAATCFSVFLFVLSKPRFYMASAFVEIESPSESDESESPDVSDLIEEIRRSDSIWSILKEHEALMRAERWAVSQPRSIVSGPRNSAVSARSVSGAQRVYLTRSFLSQLEMSAVAGDPHAVRINFVSPDRILAASAANAVAMKMAFESRREITSEDHRRLMEVEDRIDVVHRELERIEKQTAADEVIKSISAAYDRLADLVERLRMAEAALVEAEVAYKTFIQPNGTPNEDTITSEELEQYRSTWSEVEDEWKAVVERYRRRHPKYVALKNRRDVLSAKIRAEENRIVEETKTRYQRARTDLEDLEQRHSQLSSKVEQIEKDLDLAAEYEGELDSLYNERESLLTQNPEVVSGGGGRRILPRQGIQVREWAAVPDQAIERDVASTVLFSLTISFASVICVVFLMEYYDNSLKDPDRIARVTGFSPAILIPSLKVPKPFLLARTTFDLPDSPAAKSFLALNEVLGRVFMNRSTSSVAVSSTRTAEGKTTLAVNLAIAQARMSRQVVLVDANLNHPCIHQVFGRTQSHGLTSVLDGSKAIDDLVQTTDIHSLCFVSAGSPAQAASNLVGTGRMREALDRLQNMFDLVVVDTPASLVSTDAAIIANMVDSTLFVLQSGCSEPAEVKMALKRISSSGGRVGALVLNRVDPYEVRLRGDAGSEDSDRVVVNEPLFPGVLI